MIVYKLREIATGHFYAGSGIFSKNGKIYTNKGHIKNSIKQLSEYGKGLITQVEVVTYLLNEIQVGPL